ncbi:MAG: glycosyltransferase family 39 protein [Thermodesulfobacteriota bacterium]
MTAAIAGQNVIAVFRKHPRLSAALVAATALAVRIAALLSFQNSLYADYLLIDEQVYHTWAARMASGEFGTLSVPDFAPLPAYVMAAVYALLSPNPLYIRLLNMALGTGACVMVFLIGRRLGGPFAGFVSGLVAALYKPFVFFSVVLHKTALSVFLFSAFVYACLALIDHISENDRRVIPGAGVTAVLAGVIMALLINVRSNAAVMMPVALACAAWACFRERTPLRAWAAVLGGFVLGFAVAVSPFVVRDYRLTGEPALTPAGGFNLYIANNPDNPFPYYRPVRFATSTATEQAIGFVIEASRRLGRRLTPQEASSYWTGEVKRFAAGHPAAFARKVAVKVLAVLNRYESADNHHLGFLKEHISFLRWPLFTIDLLLPLGMAGLVLLGFSDRKRALAALVCLAYGATMVIFFSNVRIRLPVLVVLIPFAVLGLGRLVSAVRDRSFKTAGAGIGAAAFFFVLAFAPVPGDKDFTAYLNIHAANLASKGRTGEAVAFWERSAAMNQPYSAFANLALSGYYADRGDLEKAEDCVERIPDTSLAAAQKYEALGDLRLRRGQVNEAINAYRTSLDINYGQRKLRMKLFRLYWDIDKSLADREYAVFEYVSSFYGAMQ